MDQLPTEVLANIFDRLIFKDKLQCALTCREWCTKISSTVLYSKIRFKHPQHSSRTRTCIKYVHENNIGHQITELHLADIDDPLELLELCPNLKSLTLDDWEYDNWKDCNNASLAEN